MRPLNYLLEPLFLFSGQLLGCVNETCLPEVSVCFGELDLKAEDLWPTAPCMLLRTCASTLLPRDGRFRSILTSY